MYSSTDASDIYANLVINFYFYIHFLYDKILLTYSDLATLTSKA